MKQKLFFLGALLWTAGTVTAAGQSAGECVAPGAAIALDHVVVAVEDLELSASRYVGAGFTIKQGRLHDNGLLNAHIKFRDSTQIELMSVPGRPTDEIAAGYREFLRSGEGGAFVAFRALNDDVLQRSRHSGVRADSLGTGYVVYPDLQRVFVLRPGPGRVEDPDSILTHANGAAGIAEAWLEGGSELQVLLLALGATDCGAIEPPPAAPTGRLGRAFAVANGRIVVIPAADPKRPLVRGVVLSTTSSPAPSSLTPERAHGIWIRFVSR